ncbi:MAG: DUF3320 domain-containing protein [Inquilinaceae bacterium]
MDGDNTVTDRDKLSGLFRFAQGILAAKNQTLMRMQDTGFGYFPEPDIKDLPGIVLKPDDESWIQLARLRPGRPPAPNDMLAEWLDGFPDDPETPPKYKQVIVREVDIYEISELCEAGLLDMNDVHLLEDETTSERMKIALRLDMLDDLRIALEDWRRGPWQDWAIEERPIRKSIGLYNSLFRLHNLMHGGATASPPELVWGIGIAKWKYNSRQIDMPLIEQLVDLEVLKGGNISIRPRAVRPTFSLRPFVEMDVDGSAATQKHLQEQFGRIAASEDVEISPFESSDWEVLLDVAATRLSARAKHVTRRQIDDGTIVGGPEDDLTVYSSWAIYGRPRSENLREQDLEALRSKIEQVSIDESLPNSLRGFVGSKPKQEVDDAEDWGLTRTVLSVSQGGSAGNWSDGSPIAKAADMGAEIYTNAKVYFFPLPYNDEQARIIDRLEVEDVVTVTGPPGTGKTHSIANIISHYMATGRRVLVTARTAEAISAVRDKLPKELASLVIASVASDRDGARQLEEAIQKLSDDVITLSVDETRREISRIEADIVRLDQEKRDCEERLSTIAHANLKPLSWGGEERTAMDLARVLAETAPAYDWMTDRPSSGPPEALSATVERMRTTLPRIGEDVVYIDAQLPDPAELPTTTEILEAHRTERDYRNRPQEDHSGQPRMARDTGDVEDVAAAAHATISALMTALQGSASWERALISHRFHAHLSGNLESINGDPIGQGLRLLNDRQPGAIEYDIDLVEREKLISAVSRARFGSAPVRIGSSIFNRSLKNAIESIRVDGRPPCGPDDWERAYDALKVEDLRPQIVAVWSKEEAAGRLPVLPQTAKGMAEVMREARSRLPAVDYAVERLLAEVKRLTPLFPYGLDVERLLGDLDFEPVLKALRANLKDPYVPPKALSQLVELAGDSTLPLSCDLRNLCAALGSDDVGEDDLIRARNDLTAELIRLDELRPALLNLDKDINELRTAGAPNWASACLAEPSEADRILRIDWRDAWDWALFKGAIDSITALGNGDTWRDKKAELSRNRERQLELLIRARTLLGLKKRLTAPVQTALATFTAAVRRLGRGTGSSAVRFRKAIRVAAIEAAPAAPVWIMPEYKIAEQLPPDLENFDLVILDEASQSDITAISALARGKKHLIVGDERQVSPSAVGVPQNKIDILREEHLGSLPNRNVIDENTSVFDIAMQMYPKSHLMLREHFRCAEPIIQFSTRFYNDRLVPLRVPKASERFDPPLVDVLVKAGKREGDKNEAEARFIVDEIALIAQDPSHAHRDIAVISLIGHKQAEHIERMLIEDHRVGTDAMERFRVVCGDSRTMQGQERSVVFLSMVAAPETVRMHSSQGDAQRFNVALSRARDRLYLVRSVSTHQLKPGDLKLEVLKHFEDPMPEGRRQSGEGILDRCESPFEREVCGRLLDANYRVRSQVKAGPYRIDLVVEGADDRRLAIELDGDRWHGPEKWAEDMARQAALERAGWTFWRVFGSQWVSDTGYWWQSLVSTMTAMGIEPIGADASDGFFTEHRVVEAAGGSKTDGFPPSVSDGSGGSSLPEPPVSVNTRMTESKALRGGMDNSANSDIEGDAQSSLLEEPARRTGDDQLWKPEAGRVLSASLDELDSAVEAEPLSKAKEGAAPKLDGGRFYDEDYRETLQSIGCRIVDAAGPITFKHLCDQIARLHGFQRTGPEIKRIIWRAMSRVRARSRGPDEVEVLWPDGMRISTYVPFRGMKVAGVARNWSDLPYPEKLGLANEILIDNHADPGLAMSRAVGLTRLRNNTRQEIEAVLAVARDDAESNH